MGIFKQRINSKTAPHKSWHRKFFFFFFLSDITACVFPVVKKDHVLGQECSLTYEGSFFIDNVRQIQIV